MEEYSRIIWVVLVWSAIRQLDPNAGRWRECRRRSMSGLGVSRDVSDSKNDLK